MKITRYNIFTGIFLFGLAVSSVLIGEILGIWYQICFMCGFIFSQVMDIVLDYEQIKTREKEIRKLMEQHPCGMSIYHPEFETETKNENINN